MQLFRLTRRHVCAANQHGWQQLFVTYRLDVYEALWEVTHYDDLHSLALEHVIPEVTVVIVATNKPFAVPIHKKAVIQAIEQLMNLVGIQSLCEVFIEQTNEISRCRSSSELQFSRHH